jgi:hypothetical protein
MQLLSSWLKKKETSITRPTPGPLNDPTAIVAGF